MSQKASLEFLKCLPVAAFMEQTDMTWHSLFYEYKKNARPLSNSYVTKELNAIYLTGVV